VRLDLTDADGNPLEVASTFLTFEAGWWSYPFGNFPAVAVVAGSWYFMPFDVRWPCKITDLKMQTSGTVPAGFVARLAVYSDDGNLPAEKLGETADIALPTSATQVFSGSLSPAIDIPTPQRVWLGFRYANSGSGGFNVFGVGVGGGQQIAVDDSISIYTSDRLGRSNPVQSGESASAPHAFPADARVMTGRALVQANNTPRLMAKLAAP
jgi:hypothetical protein